MVDTADRPVDEPFTDLDGLKKSTFDTINHLYELGVVSDIAAGTYRPADHITRGTMADFMAGVLHHSNLRPAGLSIDAATVAEYGPSQVVAMVSVRDAGFGPVAGQRVDIFSSQLRRAVGLDEEGACIPDRW